ncbi:hypothetical protein B0H63DRAFT_464205 [Podospora didyma]|uniref:Uncharacterized protein n=1 Tax=Podospora didyma TaxID=330526 RepID=A0AAE0NXV4_9PEZI|nr:hypothetical protein B0H63DRAFT_464205 [Podospora didyma]
MGWKLCRSAINSLFCGLAFFFVTGISLFGKLCALPTATLREPLLGISVQGTPSCSRKMSRVIKSDCLGCFFSGLRGFPVCSYVLQSSKRYSRRPCATMSPSTVMPRHHTICGDQIGHNWTKGDANTFAIILGASMVFVVFLILAMVKYLSLDRSRTWSQRWGDFRRRSGFCGGNGGGGDDGDDGGPPYPPGPSNSRHDEENPVPPPGGGAPYPSDDQLEIRDVPPTLMEETTPPGLRGGGAGGAAPRFDPSDPRYAAYYRSLVFKKKVDTVVAKENSPMNQASRFFSNVLDIFTEKPTTARGEREISPVPTDPPQLGSLHMGSGSLHLGFENVSKISLPEPKDFDIITGERRSTSDVSRCQIPRALMSLSLASNIPRRVPALRWIVLMIRTRTQAVSETSRLRVIINPDGTY